MRKLLAASLKLLGGTRHYRHRIDLGRINTVLFRIVRLYNSTEHLMRRLAAAEVGQKFRIKRLTVFDPAGRA